MEHHLPPAAGPRAAEPSAPAGRIHRAARGGFTLVELLAAAAIVVLIAAVAVPVMMQALAKARNTAIKAEIDMLHMAIMNYKNEYGSFPPANSDFANANDPAFKHLKRLFPRCANVAAEFAGWNPVTPANALVAWLSGYSADPTRPITGAGGRRKLYDFEQGRITNAFAYHAPGKKSAPYIYIPSSEYNTVPYTTALIASNGYGAQFVPPQKTPTALPIDSREWFTFLNLPSPQNQNYANPDTFQILSAGRDEVFGTDDDLSNFWPGTRKEYLDSL